jgi:O-antigen ligase
MLLFISKNLKNLYRNKNTLILLLIFWGIYFFKVMIHFNTNADMSLEWYEYIFYSFSYCVLPFITFILSDFKKFKNVILNSLIFSGFSLGVTSLFLYKHLIIMGISRLNQAQYITGEQTLNPLALAYGGTLVISLILFKFFFKKNSLFEKIYLSLTFILSFIMLFLGSSRGSLVVLIISLLVLLYFQKTKVKLFLVPVIFMTIPLIQYGADLVGSNIFERVDNTITFGSKLSFRNEVYNLAFNEFIENPFIGGRIEVNGTYPHNIFLEILMSMGILGFILFLVLLIKSFSKVRFLIKIDKDWIFIYLLLINGLIQHLFSNALYASILIFSSMGIILSKSTKTYDES